MKKYLLLLLIPIVIILWRLCFYTVDTTEQVVVTRLGKPVRTVMEPGVHMKVPFIENVTFFSKMLLDYNAASSEILARDKKTLVIDNYCRWYIKDPLKFYLTVKNELGAFSRLQDIVYSEMRIELARHDLIDVINQNRQEIMANVTDRAREKAMEYGIYIEDVRVKRADLPPENERAVFERMSTERQRIAKQYRSEGKEEAQKIIARTDKERAMIMADAYRKVETTKGEADGKVIKIYADTYGKDAEFFEFYRSIEAFKNVVDTETDFYLTTDSPIFELLKSNKK